MTKLLCGTSLPSMAIAILDTRRVSLYIPLLLMISAARGDGLEENFLYPTNDPTTISRRWVSYWPPGANSSSPLVVFLHGGGGNANKVSGWSSDLNQARFPFLYPGGDPIGWNKKASEHGFRVVYPDGSDDRNGWNDGNVPRAGHWNDGRSGCDYFAMSSNVDDVGFIAQVINRYMTGVTPNPRVFVAGVSNGGMMTLRLARERSGPELAGVKLDAIATVVASLPEDLEATYPAPTPPRGISAILTWGTDDLWTPFNGGELHSCGRVISSESTAYKFTGIDSCLSGSWIRDPDPADPVYMEVDLHANEDGNHVRTQTVWGMGHGYPPYRCQDTSCTKEFNMTDDIWAFFEARSGHVDLWNEMAGRYELGWTVKFPEPFPAPPQVEITDLGYLKYDYPGNPGEVNVSDGMGGRRMVDTPAYGSDLFTARLLQVTAEGFSVALTRTRMQNGHGPGFSWRAAPSPQP